MKKICYLLVLAALMCACSKYPKVHCVNDNSAICWVSMGSEGVVYGIDDNVEPRTMPAGLFGAPDSLMAELELQEGVPSAVRTYIVCSKQEYTLIDAGVGGQLLAGMAELGIEPDSIRHILLTHMHGDHLGNLLRDGAPVFKNADLWLSAAEYGFWNEGDNPLQQAVLAAYADRTNLFYAGDTLPSGVVAEFMPGHTPGHSGFRFGNLLIVGDVIHGWALQAPHPEYCANFDMDKEQCVATRKAVLERCRKEHLLLGGMHTPGAFMVVE